MNNNKDSDKTYIVAWCNHINSSPRPFSVDRYEVHFSYDEALEQYNRIRDRKNCYSANITQVIESTDYHQTRAAKIVDEPKKITNDFDHWIKELDTTAQHMADWLSNNTENFEEEYLIDNARTSVQEAVQSIQENKTKNVTALPTANCVTAVLDYILYSEMGGAYDDSDPWHCTYQLLMELRNDKIDPKDLSYVSDLQPLH